MKERSEVIGLARMFFQKGQFQQAKDCLQNAIEENQNDPFLRMNLYLVTIALGDNLGAKTNFEMVQGIAPDNRFDLGEDSLFLVPWIGGHLT